MGEFLVSATSAASVSTLAWNRSLVELTFPSLLFVLLLEDHGSNGQNRKKFLVLLENISQSLSSINNRLKEGGCRAHEIRNRLVSVAILDTGFHFRLDEFRDLIIGNNTGDIPFAKRFSGIVGWKNFVDKSHLPSDSIVDESENHHGTIMARLFLQTMGISKVYIARVMRDTGDDGTAGRAADHSMNQAIEWAAEKWNADIISISLRLNKPSEDVRKSIIRANGRILIFASAGNTDQGPISKPVISPAATEQVFFIHAHNAFQKGSHFTPDPHPDLWNFQEKHRFKGDKVMERILTLHMMTEDQPLLKGKYIRLKPELLFQCASDKNWQRRASWNIADASKHDKEGGM
ncbi:hypothetical protein QBC36DRAFT_315730 [Triangularia setosa]|uniref:Peptidase S8/S53 domain-containing protein n=1 Tax=Triangularia setosa TaxID=2587417 RepID=A0AAN6VX96_9PEZI|nr:hypothetical protein QBC36DRAFT_315730 [Podospora setosa]